MASRAKFVCNSVRKFKGYNGHDFLYESEFSAVSGNDAGENAKFFAATPNGSIKISTVVEDHFTPGQTYYIDFTPAA